VISRKALVPFEGKTMGGSSLLASLLDAAKSTSPGAKGWANFSPEWPSIISTDATNMKKQPDEAELLALRAKIQITESEAAMLLSRSRQSLANARRAGKIARSIYRQDAEGGKVLYNTAALLAWANAMAVGKRAK
jgi:predicted DNA-binding protein (UPF0251 family)